MRDVYKRHEEKFKEVTEKLHKLEEELKKSRSLLCYAENWIYSPPFVRMVELVKEKKTDQMCIRDSSMARRSSD